MNSTEMTSADYFKTAKFIENFFRIAIMFLGRDGYSAERVTAELENIMKQTDLADFLVKAGNPIRCPMNSISRVGMYGVMRQGEKVKFCLALDKAAEHALYETIHC